jgi:hypothetical protein
VVERRTPLSEIETSKQQWFTAATMQSVARQSYAVAVTMLQAAHAMRKAAQAAVAEARRQLAALRGSRDAR